MPYVPYFRRCGHKVMAAGSFPQKYDFIPWIGFRPSQGLKRLVRWFHLLRCRFGRYDIVFIDRELFDADDGTWEERFRRLVPVFVLDVDDAVFLRYPEKFDRLVRMSDLVVAGNSYLVERISPANPQTVMIPTCVEMASYPEKNHDEKSTPYPVVGWMGTTGNLNYLKLVAPPLRRLARRCNFELRLVAPDAAPLRDIDLEGVSVRFVTWRGATEVDELRQFDIGLMPLFAEDEWNKYKCGLKLIQYMAVGIPGVASPVGVNSQIVEQGVDGFLASNDEEWEEILYRLIGDAELRRALGAKARSKVREHYSIEAQYPRLEQVLRETLESVAARK